MEYQGGPYQWNNDIFPTDEDEIYLSPTPNKSVGPLMLFSIIMSYLLGFLGTLFIKDVNNGIAMLILNTIVITVGSVLIPSLIYIFLKKQKSDNFYFNKLRINLFLPCILLAIGLVFLATSINSMVYSIFEHFGISFSNETLLDNINLSDTKNFIICIVCVCFAPAVCEELLCRSAILYSLRWSGMTPSAIISGAYFALLHGSIISFPTYFILGYIFGAVAYKSRSIISSMLIHFVYNFVILILTVYFMNADTGAQEAVTLTSPEYWKSIASMLFVAAVFLIPALLMLFPAFAKNDEIDAKNAGVSERFYLDDFNAVNHPHAKIGVVRLMVSFVILIGMAVLNDYLSIL